MTAAPVIMHLMLVATLFTMCAFGLVCVSGGWLLGYQHRCLIEYARKLGRVAAWRRKYRGRW